MKPLNLHRPDTGEKLSLDRSATYQIIVQGRLDSDWSDWFEGMTLATAIDANGTITTLTGLVVDQAALHGLLNRLYGLGLPLLAINCLDINSIENLPQPGQPNS